VSTENSKATVILSRCAIFRPATAEFRIISQRYERGSIIITSNRPYKKWHEIFNNDAIMTSAALDRLLHHADTIQIEGQSFRMKDQLD
jgi:DNA replication protein DnaC